jgi:Fic family protein
MYLWQASEWPNFYFDSLVLQPILSRARIAQGKMLGLAAQLRLFDLAQLQLECWSNEAVATAEIEGEILQINSVRASASRRLGLPDSSDVLRDPRTEATLDVLQAAVSRWMLPITDEILFSWQAALFPEGRSAGVKITVGGYRHHAEPMQIVTPRYGAPDIVHYQAPDSVDVAEQMSQLIDWFNRSDQTLDGFVRAAIAHLWFEAIHPFEDGNGRVGRALVERALSQDAQNGQRIWSISQQIMRDRKTYYDQLQAATSNTNLDVTPWIVWFVGCIEQAAESALEHMQKALSQTRYFAWVNDHHPTLSASQRKILAKLFDSGPDGFEGGMSTLKYVNITGQSRTTAYRELNELASLGLLERYGQGRGVRYRIILDYKDQY